MSEFKLKENTGFIFKNKYKDSENKPDYKGTINVDGKEKDCALWIAEKNGNKYFSVKIQEPYKKPESTEQTQETKQPESLNPDENNLPF